MKLTNSHSPQEWSAADLGAFFVEHRAEFVAHARRVTRTPAEAEEIVQDSLVRVLLACPELESMEHTRSYFHRVIENLSIDLHRREGVQPRLVVLDELSGESEARWNVKPDHLEAIIAAEDAAIVREAISLLSSAERAALVMWELEGRSASEIAKELGIRESAVRHTLSRARAGLRRILSERVIDVERGLTALDLLSVSYRRVEKVIEKSSKIVISSILVFAAFLGFNSLSLNDVVVSDSSQSASPSQEEIGSMNESLLQPKSTDPKGDQLPSAKGLTVDPLSSREKSTTDSFSSRSMNQAFLGLDSEGVPTGFTVTDATGSLGSLFAGQQKLTLTETGLLVSNIVSTRSGATNVLMNQSIVIDAFGTSYVAELSVGINGGWQPLRLSYISSDVERLASGNYLLTAIMVVDSALETSVKVSTGTLGTDLESAPDLVSTRVMLDPTKTKILAQAVLVSADSQEDGA